MHTWYFASLKSWTSVWMAFCLLTSQYKSQAMVGLCGQLTLPWKCHFFSQEFLILRQYYRLAPHASLYLITQIDTYMTEQKWLICGGKERLKSMVALANTGSMFSDLLECQYTGGVMALSVSHVQVIFLKVNNCHCLMFWHRLMSDKTY